ncbi:tryptophan-rich sensory protein [Flavilitoribacter nigricans]|uniref:Tryptophan-rich sensory protein n=1 Tax=Flavilitoribacter nigricans (strain ATCC 23147 / DSM 23189 / NBRC 102662 / NCIMB 1420 / SS-2) TaxID=1122177 RepID=A0A2D0NJ97_FLAN2|nr:tryptophan-rich sensory protein [Flavilitoribacter nigricans]PHN08436.1 hypothetical protein CRP01_00550 [Flavilitoribacter nigricans DSM 23189 = NBRC 102662]
MSTRTLQILNIIGFILVITLNGLANALPINGRTTGELSDLYPNLFVPAGFTFSIWGVIYLLLLGFIIYQARGITKATSNPEEVQTIGIWFFISCLANASWILAWHYTQVVLSVLIMLLILTSLIMIYRRLQIGNGADSSKRLFLVNLPFSVYLGWITVATIANVTTLLVDRDLSGFWLGETIWTCIMILIATGFGIFFLIKKRDVPYALVLIWAFYGITAARFNDNIILVAYIGMALLAVGVLFRFPRWISTS